MRSRKNQRGLLLLAAMAFFAETTGLAGQKAGHSEQRIDYYRKWLEEDVVYIISSEEKDVFQKLKTEEEKDQFIEQFWARRDPDSGTPINELKEEHYRRLQYVNERYRSGKPGWRTDRGRFYIRFGPPDRTETHAGGRYMRKSWEGGGVTSVYPFERWWYRQLEGIGSDIEVEFVDSTLSGDYRLALDAEEKDAFLRTPLGPTEQEMDGKMSRGDRISRRFMGNPSNPDLEQQQDWFNYKRLQDQIWYRVDQMIRLEKPPQLKNPKLREIVTSRISFPSTLPVAAHSAYYRLGENQFLVPISLQVENRHLTYGLESGIYTATVDVYVRVMGLDGRLYYEFDDTIRSHYTLEEFPQAGRQHSIYQRFLRLPAGHFKFEMFVKNSEQNIGIKTFSLRIPVSKPGGTELEVSPLTVTQHLSRLLAMPSEMTPFVIGNLKVVPSFEASFKGTDEIGVYFQANGIGLDPSTVAPSVEVYFREFRVLSGYKAGGQPPDPRDFSLWYHPEAWIIMERGAMGT
ncbi:MAG: GWxTD domain-containing protein, partial [Acidobacteria bacterium]|nr:GWxTD domain-containing protein [Acidobacteriota bacterium]